jgi:hypothetical protein
MPRFYSGRNEQDGPTKGGTSPSGMASRPEMGQSKPCSQRFEFYHFPDQSFPVWESAAFTLHVINLHDLVGASQDIITNFACTVLQGSAPVLDRSAIKMSFLEEARMLTERVAR